MPERELGGVKSPFEGWGKNKCRNYYRTNLNRKDRNYVHDHEPSFWDHLSENEWLDDILPKRKRWGVQSEFDGWEIRKCREYYKEELNNMPRKQVIEKAHRFYAYLKKNGWRDKVLKKAVTRKSEFDDYGIQKCREYYTQNHLGEGRREVKANDSTFYDYVWTNGWLGKVFPPDLRRRNRVA